MWPVHLSLASARVVGGSVALPGTSRYSLGWHARDARHYHSAIEGKVDGCAEPRARKAMADQLRSPVDTTPSILESGLPRVISQAGFDVTNVRNQQRLVRNVSWQGGSKKQAGVRKFMLVSANSRYLPTYGWGHRINFQNQELRTLDSRGLYSKGELISDIAKSKRLSGNSCYGK
jgi:hypothetical protein